MASAASADARAAVGSPAEAATGAEVAARDAQPAAVPAAVADASADSQTGTAAATVGKAAPPAKLEDWFFDDSEDELKSQHADTSKRCLARYKAHKRDVPRDPGVWSGELGDHILHHSVAILVPTLLLAAVQSYPYKTVSDGLWANWAYLCYHVVCWHMFFWVTMAPYQVALVSPPFKRLYMLSVLPAEAMHFAIFLSLNSIVWPFPVGTVLAFSFSMPVFWIGLYVAFKSSNPANPLFWPKFKALTIATFAVANTFIMCVGILALFWHAETSLQQEGLVLLFQIVCNLHYWTAAHATHKYVVLSSIFTMPIKAIQSMFTSVVLGMVRSTAVFWLFLAVDLGEMVYVAALTDRRVRACVSRNTTGRAATVFCILMCGDYRGDDESASQGGTVDDDAPNLDTVEGRVAQHYRVKRAERALSKRLSTMDLGGAAVARTIASATVAASEAGSVSGTHVAVATHDDDDDGDDTGGAAAVGGDGPGADVETKETTDAADASDAAESGDTAAATATAARSSSALDDLAASMHVGTLADIKLDEHDDIDSSSDEGEQGDEDAPAPGCCARTFPLTARVLDPADDTMSMSLLGVGRASEEHDDNPGDPAGADGDDVAAATDEEQPKRSGKELWAVLRRKVWFGLMLMRASAPTAEDDDASSAYDFVCTVVTQFTTSGVYLVLVPILTLGANKANGLMGAMSAEEYALGMELTAINLAAVTVMALVLTWAITYVSRHNPVRTAHRRVLQRFFVNSGAIAFATLATFKFLLYHTNADYLELVSEQE